MENIDKLTRIASPRSKASIDRANERRKNRNWLRMSQDIALYLHYFLRKSGMKQKEFAEIMGVSPVYIGRLLKGGENLTLETISKIQEVTGEEIIAIAKPYTNKVTVVEQSATRFSDEYAVGSMRFSTMKVISNNSFMQIGDAA